MKHSVVVRNDDLYVGSQFSQQLQSLSGSIV